MKFSKKNVIEILYLLGFISLFSFIFTILSTMTLYYEDFGNLSGDYDGSKGLFFRLSLILILVFSVLCVALVIINFFAKKKLNWLEVVLYIATTILIVVLLIIGKTSFSNNSVYESLIILNFAELGTLVMLLVTKLLNMFAFKREIAQEKPNEDK